MRTLSPSHQIMAMPVTLRRFTVDELDAFPDDGNRYELLDGVLFVTPALGLPHQTVATQLAIILGGFVQGEPAVQVWAPGVVLLRPNNQLEPDVLVGRRPPGAARWDEVVDRWLAIEVSGDGSRVYDRDYKRDGYLTMGVREVWLVDLRAQRILVSAAGGEKDVPYDVQLEWRRPGSDRVLRIDLADLFRDVPRNG